MKKFLIFLLTINIIFAISLKETLNKLSTADDLSNQTKKENAGYLIVFTRADLEKMKISSLKEIIKKIPFLVYNDNRIGLSDPFYSPLTPFNPSQLKLIINNSTIEVGPLNILTLLSHLDVNFIDHIEIYFEIPSFEISDDATMTVIKVYTKKGYRENINTLLSEIGIRNKKIVFESGYGNEDNNVYFYISKGISDKKDYNIQKHTISKEKKYNQLFFNYKVNNFDFEFYSLLSKNKTFLTPSFNLPTKEKLDLNLYSISANYKNNKLLIHSDFTNGNIDYYKKSDQINPLLNSFEEKRKFNTKTLSIYALKKFEIKNSTFLFKISTKHKKYNPKSNIKYNFDKSNKFSIGTQYSYLLNSYNLFSFSIKKEKTNFKNKHYYKSNYRIGYIYNKTIKIKTYIQKGYFTPNVYILNQNKDIKTYSFKSISTKITKNSNSLLLSLTKVNKYIIFKNNKFENSKKDMIIKSISFNKNLNNFKFKTWRNYLKWYNLMIYDGINLIYFKKFLKTENYFSIDYFKNRSNKKESIDIDFTSSYEFSKNLEIYFKGINILNKYQKSDYIIGFPLETINISPLERNLMIGLTWKF